MVDPRLSDVKPSVVPPGLCPPDQCPIGRLRMVNKVDTTNRCEALKEAISLNV